MTKFESSVREIPHSQTAVYGMLSDLSHIEKVKDRIPTDKIRDLQFDCDTVAMSVPPVGSVKLCIVEREEPKCIKFASQDGPVPFNLWVQVLPITDTTSKMRLTIKAELNPFIKGMVQKPLQEGIEKMADVLQSINYSEG